MSDQFIKIVKVNDKEASKIRLILLGTIVFSILTVKFYPLDLLNHYFPGLFREDSSCITLNVLGVPCPFCGMSRAFGEFINFNFAGSIYYNPSSVLIILFLGIFCLAIFFLSIFKYKILFHFNRKTLMMFFVVIALIWILNIYFGHH